MLTFSSACSIVIATQINNEREKHEEEKVKKEDESLLTDAG